MINVLLIMILLVCVVGFGLSLYFIIKNDEYMRKANNDRHVIISECLEDIQVELEGMRNDRNRLEMQEKLIAELRKTQASPEVVDTIDLINEWMNGEGDK